MSTSSNLWQSSGGGWLRRAAGLLAVTVLLVLRRLVQDYQHEKKYRFPPIRLPDFADSDSLPLIKAAVKESLRWKPSIAETGIPHATAEDDEFEGYHIPAGTVVTYNNWGIANDPTEYDQP
ncbi:hypothetical protein INS49_007404 [Diaporthe citri]|uniref:uncharacterized protein n=1 Tax=Diaporthe citri TaxID=83186 RepID=UPI001C8219EE|nr:uncharacterized protein INS49_007404 [Diaporthe citri]KAG6365793.1 hypothetical protein INS49_007404 [Diaporthe citri]